MSEKQDFHIKADKAMSVRAKELSGLSNRQLYELGCQVAIEQNRNILDAEVLELNEALAKVNELSASIKLRLKDKEVPTPPNDIVDTDENELKRNILPLDLFKEICMYYMDDFDLNKFEEMQSKNKEIFRFVLINLAHYNMNMEDIDELYVDLNSE